MDVPLNIFPGSSRPGVFQVIPPNPNTQTS